MPHVSTTVGAPCVLVEDCRKNAPPKIAQALQSLEVQVIDVCFPGMRNPKVEVDSFLPLLTWDWCVPRLHDMFWRLKVIVHVG